MSEQNSSTPEVNTPSVTSIEGDEIDQLFAERTGAGQGPAAPVVPALTPNSPDVSTSTPSVPAVNPLFTELGTLTNGQVASQEHLDELLGIRNRYTDLESRFNDLSSKDPFADDFVKSINDMRRKGVDSSEILNYTRLQTIDTSGLSDEQAIFENYKLKHPSLTPEIITAMIKQEYPNITADPNDPESVPDQAMIGKFRIAAETARNEINERIVKSTIPNDQAQQAAQLEQLTQKKRIWSDQVNRVKAVYKPPTIGLKDEKIGDYSFQYKMNGHDALWEQAVEHAVNNDIPLTRDGLANVLEYYEMAVFAVNKDDIIKAAQQHAVAQFAKSQNLKFAGMEGFHVDGNPNVTAKPVAADAMTAFIASAKKEVEGFQ